MRALRTGNGRLCITRQSEEVRDPRFEDELRASAAVCSCKALSSGYRLTQAGCKSGIEMVQVLLDYGADVNQEDEAGEPAALSAARGGHADELALLLHSGGAHHPKVVTDHGALHDWLAEAQSNRAAWSKAQEAIQCLPRSMSGMFQ